MNRKTCFNFGFDTGPAFNIFLRLCDFNVGPFVVNKYTAPGVRIPWSFASHSLPPERKVVTLDLHLLQLFMCLMWTLLQVAVILMYWDLPPLEKGKARQSLTGQRREEGNDQGVVEEEEDDDDGDEEKPLMASQEVGGSYGAVVASKPPGRDSSGASNATLSSPPPSAEPPESQAPCGSVKTVSRYRGG